MAQNRYEIAIIGGGISGLGVALEAAKNGFSCLVIEKGKCCKATSDNSLRIIHGGLRYLQHLDFSRVLESAHAQAELLKMAPDLVIPLPCVMPLSRFGLKSAIPMWCALKLYSALRFLVSKTPMNCGRIVSATWVDEHFPIIKGQAPSGAFLWYDAIMPSDKAFSAFIQDTAKEEGAEILEDTKVSEIKRTNDGFELFDDAGNPLCEARTVVNAAGAWFQNLTPPKKLFSKIDWCKAINFVTNRTDIVSDYALGVSGKAGRVFFFTKREGGTAIGTFYHTYTGDPDLCKVEEDEITKAITELNAAIPNLNLKREEIIDSELGILPIYDENTAGPVLYRSEKLRVDSGYIEILSTKFTTFREQGRKVLHLLVPFLKD